MTARIAVFGLIRVTIDKANVLGMLLMRPKVRGWLNI
jgi:hypothetical protein